MKDIIKNAQAPGAASPAHTPGPWRVQYDGIGLAIEPANRSVAYVAHIDGRGCKARLENEANARLIAAAPELLAVVRALRGLVDEYAIGDIPSRFHELAKHARAAIAKAEGGAA